MRSMQLGGGRGGGGGLGSALLRPFITSLPVDNQQEAEEEYLELEDLKGASEREFSRAPR